MQYSQVPAKTCRTLATSTIPVSFHHVYSTFHQFFPTSSMDTLMCIPLSEYWTASYFTQLDEWDIFLQWFSLALSPCPTFAALCCSFRANPLDAHHGDLQPELPSAPNLTEAGGMPPFSKASKPWHKWISWRMWKQTPPGRPALELENGAYFCWIFWVYS